VVPVIYGTNHSDFIHAFGGDFWINGFGGNDCITPETGTTPFSKQTQRRRRHRNATTP